MNEVNMIEQLREKHFEDMDNKCCMFYDWFCSDRALANKAKRLAGKAAALVLSPRFKAEECYLWFKNNFAVRGGMYDDFRIADIETGEIRYTVTYKEPRSGRGTWTVYGAENDFERPLYTGDFIGLRKWFGVL